MRARGLVVTAAVAAALWSPAAAGHPGHGPGEVGIGDNRFTPAKLTVAVGDTAIWLWNGPDTNHSVTADPGQEERFDSDPDTTPALISHDKGDSFAHRFDRLGKFTYACKVHPSMRGSVEVIKPPPADTTPPRITDLRITPRAASRSATARFRLSEASFVVASIRRASTGREVRSASAFLRRGERRLHFSVRRLRPGRYRVRLVAEDNAVNRSRPKVARLRVVRG